MKVVLFIFLLMPLPSAEGDVPDRAAIGGGHEPNAPRVAIVRWTSPIDMADARSFASATAGTLVSITDETENALVACLRNATGLALGPCDGPWIGLERPAAVSPGAAWRWIDGTPVTFTRWSEGSPSSSVRITTAAALLDDGTWIDAMPSVEAGGEIRSAAIAWPAASDQDGDGIPDTFPSGAIPTIVVPPHLCGSDRADLDGNGRVDSADLAIVLAAWGTSQDLPDLDDDGTVGPLDLGRILAAWSGD